MVCRSAPCGISVGICGAGVGGLVAALELWRKGCDVRIFERTKSSSTLGDAFLIGPSALEVFKHWPEMAKRHAEISYYPLMCFCKHTGERMMAPSDFASVFQTDKNSQGTAHTRPEFHAMLIEQLAKIGITIEFEKEVVEYYEDGCAAVKKGGVVFKDGSKYEADLIVAADGLRSKSWSLVSGEPVPAKSSGEAIFRTAYPVELAVKDPMVAERFKFEEDGSSVYELWQGPNMFATFWRNNKDMMWSIQHPDHGTAEESWSNRVPLEQVLAFTAKIPDWPEVADRVIRATPSDQLIDWKLMWRNPQPKWTSPGGVVVQIGDAAHTFLPSSGNGATQALEDGISLAACIGVAGKCGIADATRVHNFLRFERVSFLQALGVVRSESNKGACREPPMPGRWLQQHDAEVYAQENFEKALAHLREGTPFQNTNRPKETVQYQPWTINGLQDAWDNGEPTFLDGDWS